MYILAATDTFYFGGCKFHLEPVLGTPSPLIRWPKSTPELIRASFAWNVTRQ